MTVASTTRRNDYDGNGTTATHAFSFKIFAASHMQVVVRNDTTLVETTLSLTTHYTIAATGINNPSGGNVVLVAGSFDWLDSSNYLKTGYSMTLRRVPPLTQLTDIRNQGDYFPETHEDQFDLFMHILQYHEDEITRSVKLQTTSSLTGITVPDIQANKALFGKSDASGLEWREFAATTTSYPGSMSAGADASKAASPSTNDIYVATDTKRVYVCFSTGTWTPLGVQSGTDAAKPASPLAGDIYYATDTRRLYRCATAGTWIGGPVTLTAAATVATNAALGTMFRLTADQNFTLANPTNMVDGEVYTWEIKQDGTGSRVMTLGAKFAFGNDITSATLTTTAGKTDLLVGKYNASADKVWVIGLVRGF